MINLKVLESGTVMAFRKSLPAYHTTHCWLNKNVNPVMTAVTCYGNNYQYKPQKKISHSTWTNLYYIIWIAFLRHHTLLSYADILYAIAFNLCDEALLWIINWSRNLQPICGDEIWTQLQMLFQPYFKSLSTELPQNINSKMEQKEYGDPSTKN